MIVLEESLEYLPSEVKRRIEKTIEEVNKIIGKVDEILETKIDGKVSFHFTHSAPTDILSSFERAQSVCFVTKYENLVGLEESGIMIEEYKGRFYLRNIDYVRHILNEYRPIIMNKRDSIYYSKIHIFCRDKLLNEDPTKGLSVSVVHECGGDITGLFRKKMDENNKAINFIIENSEFDYIYNGILQHSDHRFTTRFWDDYCTGKINYIFLKHAWLLGYIKNLLYWHYKIINCMTFPKLGPL